MQKKIFLIEVSLTNTAAHFRSKKLNLHRTVHFCTLLMDKSETYFLNGQQSKSLRLQLFTCFQSQQRITGRVYSEWPTLIIWPTFSLKINNFCVLFFAISCVIFYRICDTLLMFFQCKLRSTTVVHITKGTCVSYTASICWVLLCTVCCIHAAFYQQNFAKCCKHAAQCAVFYQQLEMCKMLKMLPQQPVISSQCKNMQSWPICCILHRPIEWISVHNLKMWFDKAKDHMHTIPRAQDNTL